MELYWRDSVGTNGEQNERDKNKNFYPITLRRWSSEAPDTVMFVTQHSTRQWQSNQLWNKTVRQGEIQYLFGLLRRRVRCFNKGWFRFGHAQ